MTDGDSPEPQVSFHEEHGPPLPDPQKHREWMLNVISAEGKTPGQIHIFFVSDETLLKLNQEHLGHDTYTDILTFPYGYDPVEADIYISMDRVAENARFHRVILLQEQRRVMIHGILHMCGYSDHTAEEQSTMRELEDKHLADLSN